MKKLIIAIRWCLIGFLTLFQFACTNEGTAGSQVSISDLELEGSSWRLVYESPQRGHTEFDLIFSESGKLILTEDVTTPDNDEWEKKGKSIEFRLNNGVNVFKYTGELTNQNHMSSTSTGEDGNPFNWNAYRHLIKCFNTSSEQSNLNFEVCIEIFDELKAIEPYLSAWKSRSLAVHYSKGYSSSTVFGGNWLKEQKGKIYKAILRIKNTMATTQRMPVPILSDVALTYKGEQKQAAALCYPNNQLVTMMKGKAMEIDLFPNETVELLYYIPAFNGEASLEVNGLGSAKIVLK